MLLDDCIVLRIFSFISPKEIQDLVRLVRSQDLYRVFCSDETWGILAGEMKGLDFYWNVSQPSQTKLSKKDLYLMTLYFIRLIRKGTINRVRNYHERNLMMLMTHDLKLRESRSFGIAKKDSFVVIEDALPFTGPSTLSNETTSQTSLENTTENSLPLDPLGNKTESQAKLNEMESSEIVAPVVVEKGSSEETVSLENPIVEVGENLSTSENNEIKEKDSAEINDVIADDAKHCEISEKKGVKSNRPKPKIHVDVTEKTKKRSRSITIPISLVSPTTSLSNHQECQDVGYTLLDVQLSDAQVVLNIRKNYKHKSQPWKIGQTFEILTFDMLSGEPPVPHHQWISRIIEASSEHVKNPAKNIVGYPKTRPGKFLRGSDLKTSWSPSEAANQYIVAEIDQPVYIHGVEIYETLNGGCVRKISCHDSESDSWETLYSNESESFKLDPTCRIFKPKITPFQIKSNVIRIEVENDVKNSIHIDAIKVIGFDDNSTQDDESSSYDELLHLAKQKNQILRFSYEHQIGSTVQWDRSMIAYSTASKDGQYQSVKLDRAIKNQSFSLALPFRDFVVCLRIRFDGKLMILVNRLFGKIGHHLILWDPIANSQNPPFELVHSKNAQFFQMTDEIIVAVSESTVHIYDAFGSTNERVEKWQFARSLDHKSRVSSVAVNVELGYTTDVVAVGCVDGSVNIWSCGKGELIKTINFGAPIHQISLIAASSIGVVSCCGKKTIEFIKTLEKDDFIREPFSIETSCEDGVNLSFDGRYFTSTPKGDNRFQIYEISEEGFPRCKFDAYSMERKRQVESCVIL